MNIKRIAMWSGPRNISTAMMRSWENRSDAIVVDEPLYGPYLCKTNKHHPMFNEIIKAQGCDEIPIINHLTKDTLPIDKSIYYQKHMCHHIKDDMDISWINKLINVFLIRDPRHVLSSYLKKYSHATPEDLGYPQQLKLFNHVKQNCNHAPIVMDSKDILQHPKAMMELLCSKLNVEFDNNMLSWPKGYRDSDGIWASHWYNRVIESTGFVKYKTKPIHLSNQQELIADECMAYYLELKKYRVNYK